MVGYGLVIIWVVYQMSGIVGENLSDSRQARNNGWGLAQVTTHLIHYHYLTKEQKACVGPINMFMQQHHVNVPFYLAE